MTGIDDKVRLVVGLFAEPDHVVDVVRELSLSGIARERVSLVFSTRADDAAPATRLEPDLLALETGLGVSARRIASAIGEPPDQWVLSLIDAPPRASRLPRRSGHLRRSDRLRPARSTPAAHRIGPTSNDRAPPGNAVLDRQIRKLQEHIQRGGRMLVVELESTSDQGPVCQTLLAHACLAIQTHELRRQS